MRPSARLGVTIALALASPPAGFALAAWFDGRVPSASDALVVAVFLAIVLVIPLAYVLTRPHQRSDVLLALAWPLAGSVLWALAFFALLLVAPPDG